MNKLLKSSLFILISLCIVLILRYLFPKNSGFLWFFLVFLLLDAYLWHSLQPGIKKLQKGARFTLFILYWFPLACIFVLMITGFIIPYLEWGLPLRTYAPSFILIIFLCKVFPILTLVFAEVVRGIQIAFKHQFSRSQVPSTGVQRNRPLLVSGWVAGIIFFIILTYGSFFGPYQFKVYNQTIPIHNLPTSFEGFRIVQFSDVHLGSWVCKKELKKAIQMMNSLNPDVIFFTGDMFNFSTADGLGFENILADLKSPNGVYAILGNHDYGDYINWPSSKAKLNNLRAAKEYYHDLRWKLLLNTHDFIIRGADSIAILGVENWGATQRFQRLGDIDLAQKGLDNRIVKLLLSHDPSHWDSIISRYQPSVNMTFSGHTHGGQFGMEFGSIHWSPIKLFYHHWCGLYTGANPTRPQYLYVNQGLGCIGYAGRIGISPEITVFTLRKN